MYAKLNQDLAAEDRSAMVKWFPYLKLLISAMSAEPKVTATLWRGVKADIANDYPKGKKFRWWRFSSCTEDGDALDDPNFLGKNGTRTLFCIETKTGIKIAHFSAYPDEAEVLIPPGTRFEVSNVISPAVGLTVVALKEIKAGLSYQEPGSTAPPAPSMATPTLVPMATSSSSSTFTSTGETKTNSNHGSKKWNCSSCTLLNQSYASSCAACGSSKVMQSGSSTSNSSFTNYNSNKTDIKKKKKKKKVSTFKVGQSVTWTKSNSDLPKGTVGVITRLYVSESQAGVKFPKGSWKFPFKELKASSKKPTVSFFF